MDRRTLLRRSMGAVVGATLGSAAGCSSPTPRGATGGSDGTAVSPSAGWPQFGHDPANTGFAPAVTGPTATPAVGWRADHAPGAPGTIAAVTDGTVYYGVDRTLHAVGRAAGELRWTFEADNRYGAEGIDAEPAVRDGTVYLGADDWHVYALDAETGEQRWATDLDAAVWAGVTAAGGHVYVATGVIATVAARDAATGEIRWRVETESNPMATPATDGERVYVATSDGVYHAFDAETGRSRWSYTDPRGGAMTAPTVAGGHVYVTADLGEERGGRAIALDAETGEVVWSTELIGTDLLDGVAVADGTVYAGASDPETGFLAGEESTRTGEDGAVGVVYALDARTGDTEWRSPVAERPLTTPPTVVANALFVAHPDAILALDPGDGTRLWRYDLSARDVGVRRPLSAAAGTLFGVLTGPDGGALYAFTTA